ncbi:MAG: hypothetical protein HGGPFJEG_00172 [Ignavibacteria bacterium]|nr:hypothetical protein [Ignavibacteria bacterium]
MSENIKYRNSKNIRESDILNLYEDAGWTNYTKDKAVLYEAIRNSYFVVSAFENDKLVGLIRVVSDGLTIVYIQDILVLNSHKRKKIGTELMKIVLEEFKNVRQKVLLTDDSATNKKFYESLGFTSVINNSLTAYIIMENQ